jgi:adenosine kinase
VPKINPSKPRVVVITSGPGPTILVSSGFSPTEPALVVPVDKVADSDLVDTNGAGDAFAGGFIGAYLAGEADFKKCVEVGHRLARLCVQQVRFFCEFALDADNTRVDRSAVAHLAKS